MVKHKQNSICFMTLVATLVILLVPLYSPAQQDYDDFEDFDDPNQPKIDSLLRLIKSDSPDSIKAQIYYKIAEISSRYETKIDYAQKSLDYCKKTDLKLFADNCYLIGTSYYLIDEAFTALPYNFRSALAYHELKLYTKEALNYNIIGNCYEDLNFPDSIFHYHNKALEIYSDIKDTENISYTYCMIGRIYFNMDLFATATENYQKALYYSTQSHDTLEMASCYYYLGMTAMDDSDKASNTKAIDYFKKSASLYELKNSNVDYYEGMKIGNYSALASAYIAEAKLTGNKAYADSCYYLYDKKVGDYYLEHGEYSNYVSDCYNYVEYLKFLKEYQAALDEMLRLEKYIKEESSPVNLKDYHLKLYEVYKLLGDYKTALKHFERYDKYKSLIFNDSTLNSLKDAELRRSHMLNVLKLENAENMHAAEKLRMRIVNISLIGGVLLLSLLILNVFRLLKIKHKSNAELSAKNELLAVQKAEIEMQSSQIQSSINYARRIQRALLTPKETVARIFPNNFVLYIPRDVVSGDFFWVGQFGDNKVCIVADCTGHGVPGGFMSMLGMTNLNFIVNQDIRPDEILEKLRQSVISSLNQNEDNIVDSDTTILDGMDAVVFVVNEKKMTLTYAGANSPLILIRDNELQILKPDKMPVGIALVMTPFNSVTMELRKGDCLYAYSDGFKDQFANGTFEKFSSHRLRELLLEIHQRPMSEQRDLLNQTFEEWRGPASNQTDDVVIMGVRI